MSRWLLWRDARASWGRRGSARRRRFGSGWLRGWRRSFDDYRRRTGRRRDDIWRRCARPRFMRSRRTAAQREYDDDGNRIAKEAIASGIE